jgi:hypothetical protein
MLHQCSIAVKDAPNEYVSKFNQLNTRKLCTWSSIKEHKGEITTVTPRVQIAGN